MNSDSVLEIFREITKIPRESGHEEKMTAFLQNFAKEHGLGCRTDATGNVVITKEASKGKERACHRTPEPSGHGLREDFHIQAQFRD